MSIAEEETSIADVEIIMTSGRQRGAHAALPAGEPVIIGSDMESDIVLLDTPDPVQASLTRDEQGQWLLTAHEGEFVLQGQSCDIDEACAVETGQSISTGPVSFMLESVLPADEALDQNALATADGKPPRAGSLFSALMRTPLTAIGFGVLGLCGVALASVGLTPTGSEPAAVSKNGFRQIVREALDDAGYARLGLVVGPERELVVSGTVPSWEDHIALTSLLDEFSSSVEVNAHVARTLEETVADVYRVNGIKAEVEAMGSTRVAVVTQVADKRKLRRIEAAVRADVPALTSLQRRNDPPPKTDKPAMADNEHVEDPGKRVMTVVVGNPAYIVTEDLSRYFVGSSLPTGHRITGIEKRFVTLDKAGVETELQM